jgi:hypothetical protein
LKIERLSGDFCAEIKTINFYQLDENLTEKVLTNKAINDIIILHRLDRKCGFVACFPTEKMYKIMERSCVNVRLC